MSKESWYINESELDDYQVPIIQKKMDRSFIVKGCAGSGKTVLALWKAKEIATAKLGSYYFIVYTKALRQFIDDGVKEVGLEKGRVLHFAHWEKMGRPQADFVIVDEVQDFEKKDIDYLVAASLKNLLFFGDSAQQIYRAFKSGLFKSMDKLAQYTDLSIEPLILNHRLPRKIARVAEYLNEEGDSLVSRCKKEGANKPFLIKVRDKESQLEFIKDTIEERDYDDVGILFPQNRDVKSADQHYGSKSYLIESKYDISYPDDKKFNLNFHSSNPKLMTYHSAKGLQFQAVFIPDCTRSDLPGGDSNPLYVAITRTYEDLFIIYSGELSSLLKDVPLELFEFIDMSNKPPTPQVSRNVIPTNGPTSDGFEEDSLPF
jgi:superfamily I DNA/RNA helicase